jgi:hypothetical protein
VPPRYPWADVSLPHEGFFMLAYLQPFCNSFPVWPPPGRRRPAAAARRPWDHPRWMARRWRRRDRARAPLSTPHRHLTRMDSPRQLPIPRTWGLYRLTACAITTPRRAAGPGNPDHSAVERRPLVPTGEVPLYLLEKSPCTYWRSPLVPTGEVPLYLLEKSPCTYWRSPLYLLEKIYDLSGCYSRHCAP